MKTVRVSIGELAGVDIPSLEFAWQSVRKGGVAQNAELEIERPNGEAWCLQCQKTIPLHRYGDPCPDCGGRGQVNVQQRTPFGVISTTKTCTRCGGKGKIVEKPCQKCRGGGRVSKRRELEVNIPAGIDDRQVISVRGEGSMGSNGGPSGDLHVSVFVRPHPFFEREGYNIWYDCKVNFVQAALGDSIMVPTIDGKVKFDLPAGTQPAPSCPSRARAFSISIRAAEAISIYA